MYLLCSYNWSGYFYNMPWAAQLDGYYSYFGNGYVPYFAVIGADYEYLHGGNNVSGAMNAAENAMGNIISYPPPENFTGIIEYPDVNFSWEEPETNHIITGYNIYRDGVQIADVLPSQTTWTDVPPQGDYIYTVRTQYVLNESDDSEAVNINYYNIIGDVNANLVIEAYDASLILHYIIGIEPAALPFPWEEWRIERADTDDNGSVEAYDAALVLQYVVELISQF